MKNNLKQIVDQLIRRIERIELHEVESSELSNLSRKQIFYLDTIKHLHNPTLSELAIQLQLSKPSITAIVDRFVANGYVVKVKSDADKRSSHVHLTEQGESISKLHDNIHDSIANQLSQNLTNKEVQQLVNILDKALYVFPNGKDQ